MKLGGGLDLPLTSHLGGSTGVAGAHSCDGGGESSGGGLGDDRGTGDLGDCGKHLDGWCLGIAYGGKSGIVTGLIGGDLTSVLVRKVLEGVW
jgi:hypothetical protein